MITVFYSELTGISKMMIPPVGESVMYPAGMYFYDEERDLWTGENSYDPVFVNEWFYIKSVCEAVEFHNSYMSCDDWDVYTPLSEVIQKLEAHENHLFEVAAEMGLNNHNDTPDWINYKDGDLDLPF